MHSRVAGIDFIVLNHSKTRHSHQEDVRLHLHRRAGQWPGGEIAQSVRDMPWCIEEKGSNALWGLQGQWHSWTLGAARLEHLVSALE